MEGEGPYRRQDVVLESIPMESEFTEVLDKVQHPYTEVRVTEVKEDEGEPLLVYKPEHPLANEEGYVAMPNVNPVTESANMISAERAYQNDVNIFQTTKQMALKALEIGK
jgi:flagellar basal-body rod protein FlgC